MPLSETNKVQSSSIENLIAQLDAPADSTGGDCTRKLLKGKRSTNGHGCTDTASTVCNGQSAGNGAHDPVLSKNIIMSKKYSRHTRTGLRGQAKKGGAGGKHTWGAPGCELTDEYLDNKDPNYDSEEEGNVVMVCMENSDGGSSATGTKKSSKSRSTNNNRSDPDELAGNENLKELDIDELESEIKLVILEYFQNGDASEVIDHLKCYNFFRLKATIIAYFMQVALEHNNTCKELISRLLRDLAVELFSERDFENGFDVLMKNLPDLILDNPDAPEKTGTFIARAIADKVLAKSYLDRFQSEYKDNNATNLPNIQCEKIQKAVESARLLVNMNDHLFHMSHIWGNKGGFLAVKELTDKINELIQEYYDSGDIDEAIRCLRELNVPHFHHEFIFEALDFSFQKGDKAIDLIAKLFKRLCSAVIVTYDQLKIGFTRIYDILPDICLDVPNANALMENILTTCQSNGVINDDIVNLAPNRSRKRFVSEGDGGRFKENTC